MYCRSRDAGAVIWPLSLRGLRGGAWRKYLTGDQAIVRNDRSISEKRARVLITSLETLQEPPCSSPVRRGGASAIPDRYPRGLSSVAEPT